MGSPGGRNVLINGNMARAQRIGETVGNFLTVAASSQVYQMDRWYFIVSTNQASAVTYVAGTNFPGNIAAANFQRNNGQTGTSAVAIAQALDADQINRLQGKFVTLTCRFLTGANWTAANVALQFFVGTGAPAKRGVAFPGETIVVNQGFTTTPGQGLTTVTVTSTAIVPSNATQGQVNIGWTPVGTATTSDLIQIGNVQLEPSIAFTGWDYTPAALEWTMCQRFYWKSFAAGQQPATNIGVGAGLGRIDIAQTVGAVANQIGFNIPYPVRMRGNPNIVLFNPSANNNLIRNTSVNADTSANTVGTSDASANIDFTTAAGSAAGNRNGFYLTAEAEL